MKQTQLILCNILQYTRQPTLTTWPKMLSMPRMRKLDLERRKLAEDGGICFFFLTIGNEVENKAKGRNARAQAPQCPGPAQCGLR